MTEKLKSKRGNFRRETHKFETRDAALDFLSKRLTVVGPNKTAVSLSEGSLTVTDENGHKTTYRLLWGGLRVMIEVSEPANDQADSRATHAGFVRGRANAKKVAQAAHSRSRGLY